MKWVDVPTIVNPMVDTMNRPMPELGSFMLEKRLFRVQSLVSETDAAAGECSASEMSF